ncbi:serine/threonine protein kinase [Labilithrix luteola]|uniref:Serine/threonine protein kinase n=1 Tax=Labilithrix luteola TaxID=1391654 RepID=A0A0K1PZG5_9BACT|nr:serine/threonine-protein kinase [Labilithrix luteola]AKU98918.1 serine/threonine protein kinase [Labilithrix luteola]
MASLPPEDLLPVLVADLADDASRDILYSAALSGTRVFVPLETAPVNASQHVLEVHIPSMSEPLFFLAQPLGPPTEDGFPLRVATMPNQQPGEPNRESPVPSTGVVRGRRGKSIAPLTASHTADLSVVGPLPSPPADALVGRALAGGKLMIEHLIGRGGVGAVYKARHRELRMPVAVKVLHESFQRDIDFCRRFYAEALAASRLDHPNITRVIDFGQEPDGLLYLAMEFLDGVELRDVLAKEGPLDPVRIATVMMQVCAGLSHAHARGIVHRDIKPENLVIVQGQDDDGRAVEIVKVCDFGIAQHRAATANELGVISGTPEYMSPEQCRGDELDARSDVYACGVVLYELATGQVPFQSERPQSILNRHQFTPPVPPSTLRPGTDPTLEKVILHALEKEAEDRPQSMRDLRVELRQVQSPAPIEAAPNSSVVAERALGAAMPTTDEIRPITAAQAATLLAQQADEPPPSRVVPSPPQQQPEWLERNPVYASSVAQQAAANQGKPPSTGKLLAAAPAGYPPDELADALQQNAAGWLRRVAKTTDVRAFSQFALRLDPALRALAARGDTKTLWAVSSTLQGIAMEGPQAAGSRAQIASRVSRVFEDPAILATVAEQLLSGTEEARDYARRLLVHGGISGAYGLYGARVKLASDPHIRGPFIAAVKDCGRKAWPVVRAALEKILDSDYNPRTLELAEDLLLCVPTVGDESAGNLVVKYLRINVSGVCRAATAAIVTLWGERAKPLLVGMVQSKDDVVRIAGIAGLRQQGSIDEHVVPRLSAILLRRMPAGDDVRAAAAIALANVTASAQKPAISVLTQLLTPSRDARELPPRPPQVPGTLSREDAVILASAHSLLALSGRNYRGLVAERAERSAEPLKSQLKRLLGSLTPV